MYTVKASHIIEGVDTWTQSTVETENLIVNESCKWEVVEKICKVLPDIRITIFAKAFVIETVDLGDLARFVVSAEDRNSGGITYLQRDKESDCFYRIISTVDIVT